METLLETTSEKFRQVFLGRAYSLWTLLPADNRPDRPGWTPAKKYRYKYLARSLGCSFATIRGGLRPCGYFERSKKQGEPLVECCGRYYPIKWDHVSADGNHQCMHWNPGLMEKLYNEGLPAVEEKGDPGKPRSHVLRLQVRTKLPQLTPYQTRTLSKDLQLEYQRRLAHIARQTGFDVEAWKALTEKTLVPQMADYNRGRTLFDVYRPNLLLDTCVSSRD